MKKIALITGMLMLSTAAFGQAMIYPHPDGSYTINRPGISGYSTQVYRHPDGSYTANDEWGTTQITPQVGGGYSVNTNRPLFTRPDMYGHPQPCLDCRLPGY